MGQFMTPLLTGGLNLLEQGINVGYLKESEQRQEDLGREAIDTFYTPMMNDAFSRRQDYQQGIDQKLANDPQYTGPAGLQNQFATQSGGPQNQYGGNIYGQYQQGGSQYLGDPSQLYQGNIFEQYQPGGQFSPTGAAGAYGQLGSQVGGLQSDAMNAIMGITNQSRADIGRYGDTGFLGQLQGAQSFESLAGRVGGVNTSFEAERRAAQDQLGKAQAGTATSALTDAMRFRGNLSPDEMAMLGQQNSRLQSDALAATSPGINAQYAAAERGLQQGLRGQDIGLLQFAQGQGTGNQRLAAQLQGGMQGQQLSAAMGVGAGQLGATTQAISGYQGMLSGNLGAQLGQELGQSQFGAGLQGQDFQNMLAAQQQGLAQNQFGAGLSQQDFMNQLAGRGQQMGEIGQGLGYGQQDIANTFNVEQQQSADYWNNIQAQMGMYNSNQNQLNQFAGAAGSTLSGLPSVAPQVNFAPTFQSIMAQQMAANQPSQPSQKFGGNVSVFGTGGGAQCVDGDCRVMVMNKDWQKVKKAIKDVEIGDLAMTASGDHREVVAKDYGLIPEEYRPDYIKISTDRGDIVLTEDHVIGGHEAGKWKKCDQMTMADGSEVVVLGTEKVDFRPTGDIRLVDGEDYATEDGFVIRSSIPDINFTTMPLTMVNTLEHPEVQLEQYHDHTSGKTKSGTMSLIESSSGALTMTESLKVARALAPDADFFKEGHTSSVFASASTGVVINVARDRMDASEDLRTSFDSLRRCRSDNIVRVMDITSVDNVCVAVVDVVRNSKELTIDGMRLGKIEWFNGKEEPDITWLDDGETRNVMGEIIRLENENDIVITINHGDAVLTDDGDVWIVACDGVMSAKAKAVVEV